MRTEAERENKALLCFFGTVYVGTEVLKEWAKEIPKTFSEVGSYFCSSVENITKRIKNSVKNLAPLLEAPKLMASTIKEAASFAPPMVHVALKESKNVCKSGRDVLNVLGEGTLEETKEISSYIRATVINGGEFLVEGCNSTYKHLRLSSTLRITSSQIIFEYTNVSLSCGKQALKPFKNFTIIEIGSFLKKGCFKEIGEISSYGRIGLNQEIKLFNKTVFTAGRISKHLLEFNVYPLFNECTSYPPVVFIVINKEIRALRPECKILIDELENISKQILKESFSSLEVCGNKTIDLLSDFSRYALYVNFCLISAGLLMLKESLDYGPAILIHTKKITIYVLKWCQNIHIAKMVRNQFYEVFSYLIPTVKRASEYPVKISNHLLLPCSEGLKNAKEIIYENIQYPISFLNQANRVVPLILRDGKEGTGVFLNISFHIIKENVSYLSLEGIKISLVNQMVIRKDIHYLSMTLFSYMNEPFNYLPTLSRKIFKECAVNLGTPSFVGEIALPSIQKATSILKENRSFSYAIGYRALKFRRILEEDFPSSFQHFIVDPARFWYFETRLKFINAKERFKIWRHKRKREMEEIKNSRSKSRGTGLIISTDAEI